MENTKKSKNVLNGLVYVVMLVLIGVVVYQNHQIRKLSHALNPADETTGKIVPGQDDITQNSANRNAPSIDRVNGQDDYDELKYQLGAAEEELDMARGQLADEIARNDQASTSMGPQTPEAMLATPEDRKKLRNGLKNGFDQTYSGLYKELGLSPEKTEELKELLADQKIAQMESNKGIQDGPPTEEEIKNLQKQFEEQKNQDDAALKALLGDEGFDTYEDYTDRSRERGMIRMLSQRLSFDDTLTGDQKTSLLETLYNKRKDTYSQQGFDEENLNFILGMNDEGIPKMMEMQLLVYDGYIKGVEEAGLSESQEKQLKGFLEEQQAMMKSMAERQAKIASGELDPNTELDDGAGMIMIFD